jgi:cell division protein FtsB
MLNANKLNQEQASLRAGLLLLPLVGPKLVKLTQNGVTEQDIINIAAVFEKHIPGKDKQSVVSELEVYGGLKSAIQELSKQSDTMKMEVSLLQSQNQDLNKDNQRILSSLINSRYTADFLHGLVNSLRNEILGLVLIAASIAYYYPTVHLWIVKCFVFFPSLILVLKLNVSLQVKNFVCFFFNKPFRCLST